MRTKIVFWHRLRIYSIDKTKQNMGIVILILLFCGALLLGDRMLCGFVSKMSNSKKLRK